MRNCCFPGWTLALYFTVSLFAWMSAIAQPNTMKEYLPFRVVYEIRDGVMIDETTKLTAEDNVFIQRLEEIGNDGKKDFERKTSEVLTIIENTSSGLVVEKALILLRKFPTAPKSAIISLHRLAYCKDPYIRLALVRTLGWFGFNESIPMLLFLVGDQNMFVRNAATVMLCYVGIEAVAAIPQISDWSPKGLHVLFLAKILRHICFLVMIAAGQGILPSALSAVVPPGIYSENYGGGIIFLRDKEVVAGP